MALIRDSSFKKRKAVCQWRKAHGTDAGGNPLGFRSFNDPSGSEHKGMRDLVFSHPSTESHPPREPRLELPELGAWTEAPLQPSFVLPSSQKLRIQMGWALAG